MIQIRCTCISLEDFVIIIRNRHPLTFDNAVVTGQMVFCADEKVGISSLYHLLWCAVTDDFEVRSKAVAMIIG